MKLSEIKGERAIEVIADLVEPITSIAMDRAIRELFSVIPKDGETPEEAAARTIKAKIPYLLKHYKKELAQILGTLENKNPEDLNILEIIKGVAEMVSDKPLMQLFSSAVLTVEAVPHTEECKK